jgi:hypothetical protein
MSFAARYRLIASASAPSLVHGRQADGDQRFREHPRPEDLLFGGFGREPDGAAGRIHAWDRAVDADGRRLLRIVGCDGGPLRDIARQCAGGHPATDADLCNR